MANWFTRLVDRVTPWDRGGEVQRREEARRKREEEEAARRANAPRIQTTQPTQRTFDQPLRPQQPVNIFETLNKGLTLGQNQPGVVPVFKTPDVQPEQQPKPGTVIQPQSRRVDNERDVMAQYRAGKINRQQAGQLLEGAQANTEASRAHEQAKPPIAMTAFRVATALPRIAIQAPARSAVRLSASLAPKYLRNKFQDEKSGVVFTPKNTFAKALLGDAPVTTVRGLAKEPNRPKATGIGKVLENPLADVPLSIADLVYPGALKGATKVLTEPKNLLDNTIRTTVLKDVEKAAEEARPRPIPVRNNIPVDEVIGSDSIDVPVQVRTVEKPKGPIIRDVTGGAKEVTSDSAIGERAAQIQRTKADAANKVTVPGRKIEDIKPRPGEKPFVLSPEAVAGDQGKLIDEYATFLRDVGEGNGTQLVPDGTGGYLRNSNNVRFGDTAGKRMSQADWREEAERQLRAGEADTSIQKAFNEATDPEIQDLLARGERPTAPKGEPIIVKQATGIPVRGETVVPQNLPETPGTVRVTGATAPNNAESAVVAAEASPVSPKSMASEVVEKVPTTPKQADEALDGAYERLVKSLRENQAAQRVEKKINSAEKSRRFKEKTRLYNEMVASGMPRKEAEARSTALLKGKYTDNVVSNFDVNSKQAEAFRKAIDEVSDDPFNTKRAFEHMIDPSKTDPLQPWERTRIRAFVQKTLGEDAAQSLDEAIVLAEQTGDRTLAGNIASFVTSVTASGDISAVGRQGLSGLINHPVMSGQAFKEAMGALVDPKKAEDFVRRLVADPDTAFIQQNIGTHYLSLSKVADEARGGSEWAENFAGTRWFVNPSERHYNTYLDSLRHQQTKAILERYGGQDGFLKAAEASGHGDKWMKAWGRVINVGSGRGTLGKSASPAVGDVQVLFSARNLASKLQRLTSPFHLGLLRTNPQAYLYQLKEAGTTAAVVGTALATAAATGLVDVENGKIKIGKSRYDISGGFATIINSLNNIKKAYTEPSSSGIGRTGLDIVKDFSQNQLSPLIGSLARLLDVKMSSKGELKDRYGNPVDSQMALDLAPLPAPLQTGLESQQEGEGWMQTAANLFANALGVNVNTYQSADDKEIDKIGADTFKTLRETEKQLEKDGIATTKTDINDYIDDGDYDKASRAAEYNLMALKADKNTSESRIKRAEVVLQEINLHKDGVPVTDDGIKAMAESGEWDKAIKGYQWKIEKAKADGEYSKAADDKYQTEIKRIEVTRDGNFPPEIASLYNDMSNSEWHKLGDPESEDYDPDLYEALWAYDEALAGASVSGSAFKPDKQKYSAKKSGSGRGGKGKGSRKIDTSFGTLGNSSFAPRVQQYDTIDSKSSSVPIIRTVRPNIVHKITSSG